MTAAVATKPGVIEIRLNTVGQLFNRHFPDFNIHPHFFCYNLQALVRYRRKNSMGSRSDIGISFYSEKVCRAGFIDVFLLFCIEE